MYDLEMPSKNWIAYWVKQLEDLDKHEGHVLEAALQRVADKLRTGSFSIGVRGSGNRYAMVADDMWVNLGYYDLDDEDEWFRCDFEDILTSVVTYTQVFPDLILEDTEGGAEPVSVYGLIKPVHSH